MKPGYKTTEFWLTLLGGNLAPLIASFGGALPPQYAAIAVAVSNGLYAFSRGIAKQ